MKKIRPSFVPAIIWLIISTVLLTLPGTAFPKDDWFNRVGFDKWVHTGMFAVMTLLWCWAMLRVYADKNKLRRIFLWMLVTWVSYGIIMEFIQLYFIINRSFDGGDIIADTAGAVIGYAYSVRVYTKK